MQLPQLSGPPASVYPQPVGTASRTNLSLLAIGGVLHKSTPVYCSTGQHPGCVIYGRLVFDITLVGTLYALHLLSELSNSWYHAYIVMHVALDHC